MLPNNWPKDVTYIRSPKHSSKLTEAQIQAIRSPLEALPKEQIIPLPLKPSPPIRIRIINDQNHPAYNQHGLFATKDLPPDSLIITYLGLIHSNSASDTNATSNYDLSLDREAGISVDATTMGTEARFINDYRGVRARGPNAEFRDVWLDVGDGVGERGIGVFVLSAGKAGKRREGIGKGEEIVVSYGKGFWRGRAGEGGV